MRRWGSETATTLSRCVFQEVSNKFPRTFQGLAPSWKAFIWTKSGAWCRTFQISKQVSLLIHVPSHFLEGYQEQPSRSPFCYFIECWRTDLGEVYHPWVDRKWQLYPASLERVFGCVCFFILLDYTFRLPLRVPYGSPIWRGLERSL